MRKTPEQLASEQLEATLREFRARNPNYHDSEVNRQQLFGNAPIWYQDGRPPNMPTVDQLTQAHLQNQYEGNYIKANPYASDMRDLKAVVQGQLIPEPLEPEHVVPLAHFHDFLVEKEKEEKAK